jgi:hypothetical protein
MTFSEAFTLFPYDVERIALETGIKPPEVDHLINTEMNRLYAEKAEEVRARLGDETSSWMEENTVKLMRVMEAMQ